MTTRHIVFYSDPALHPEIEALAQQCPGVEIYQLDDSAADLEHEINMALLNDLHTPLTMAFVGGAAMREAARRNRARWVDGAGEIVGGLLEHWRTADAR